MDLAGRIRELLVERGAARSEAARRLGAWARRRGIAVRLVDGGDARRGRAAPDAGVDASKLAVRVVPTTPGAVLKPCTGRTEGLVCCNLHVVTQTVGCPLDCAYCILQAYQNREEIVVQAGAGTLLRRLEDELGRAPRRLRRVCTGQVADSLALEPMAAFAERAVERFRGLDNAVLELKTKTANVDLLLPLDHGGRTVVSFSLNPPATARAEEHRAAPVEDRLAAAARVARAGYLLAFHLDPMVTVDGDPAPFVALVERIADSVPRARVAYLSMGAVRFQPRMRRTITARFPGTRVTTAELLPDVDGKLRPLAPVRIALYRAVAGAVSRLLPRTFVYLCMEPPRVWRRALGRDHRGWCEVDLALARNLDRRFGLAPAPPVPADYR